MDGPPPYWVAMLSHPLLDQRLEYGFPTRPAAEPAHRILKLLVAVEPWKLKIRAKRLGKA